MKTIEIGGFLGLGKTKIELYDSCQEMPITRYHDLQKLSMLDMGIGSTVEDFNGHFSKLHAYLVNDKKDDSIKEMQNIFKNFYYMIERVGVWSYSILPFVHSINGKEFVLDDDDYKGQIESLSKKGLTVEHCESQISELKKKFTTNWSHIFLKDIIQLEMQTLYPSLKDSL